MFVNEYIGGKLGLQEKNLSNSIYLVSTLCKQISHALKKRRVVLKILKVCLFYHFNPSTRILIMYQFVRNNKLLLFECMFQTYSTQKQTGIKLFYFNW